MSFSRVPRRSWIAALLSVVVLGTSVLSCGLRTGESSPAPLSPSFKGESYSCVGMIPESLDMYFKNEMSVEQIRAFIGCLQRAFVTFSQLTRGRDEGVYSPEELRNFIQLNFLRNRYVISDLLLSEFMMIKQVLVGGSPTRVTRTELYAIVAVLDDIRDEAIRLKPHLPLINPELAQKMTPEEKDQNLAERLRRANEALSATIRTFGSRLEKSPSDYSIDDLHTFLLEFRRFVHWDDHFKEAAPVEAWIKLLKTFKVATVAPFDGGIIHPDDWAPLFTAMWRWYGVFVHYRLGVKGQLVLEDVGLQNLILFAGEIFDLTREAIQKQPDLTLSFDTIVSIFDSARDIGWLPKQLRSDSVRKVLQAFTTRIFGDPRVAVQARSSRGLTMDSLASLSADFYRWARTQADLNVVWAKGMTRPVRTPNLQARNYINPGSGQQIAGPRSSEYTDFMRVNQLIEPIFPESTDGSLVRVFLAQAPVRTAMGVGQSFTNLSYMLLARTVVGLVFRGYADSSQNRSTWSDGISSDELEQFSEDIRDLGVDLKIVDWRNCNVGARSFAEGNLFTYTSDGVPSGGPAEGKLDMREAIQLSSYLYSGGSLANEYYDEFSRLCEKGPDDINHLAKVSRECVRRELGRSRCINYDNLPGLRDYLAGSVGGKGGRITSRRLLEAVFTTKNFARGSARRSGSR